MSDNQERNKKAARRVQQILAELGYPDVKLNHCFELLARLAGHKNWHVATAKDVDVSKPVERDADAAADEATEEEQDDPIQGFPAEVWWKAYEAARSALIPMAIKGKPCSYKYLAEVVLLPVLSDDYKRFRLRPFTYHDDRLNFLLGEILRIEYAHGRPPLTAMITLQEDPNHCGKSFYIYCEELGYFVRNDDVETRDDELAFWIESVKELQRYWKSHKPKPPRPE